MVVEYSSLNRDFPEWYQYSVSTLLSYLQQRHQSAHFQLMRPCLIFSHMPSAVELLWPDLLFLQKEIHTNEEGRAKVKTMNAGWLDSGIIKLV